VASAKLTIKSPEPAEVTNATVNGAVMDVKKITVEAANPIDYKWTKSTFVYHHEDLLSRAGASSTPAAIAVGRVGL
jgi:hypothetical protein